MNKYDYIPNEFGRTWVASRHEARRGVHTPLAYIDINEGNRFDADVFAQIMYWHEPSTETGASRLTRHKDDNLWLTKNHSEWFKETRIKLQTVRKCLTRLKERKLIIYELHGEKGDVCPWIRVNWDEFERRMKLWIDNNVANVVEKDYETIVKRFFNTPVTREQGVCSEITEGVLSNNSPMLPEVKSNTKTTAKTDKEIAQGAVVRKRNPIFDAVAEHIFDINPLEIPDDSGGRIGIITSWLSGKSEGTKRTGGKVGFISRPAEPDHVKRFATWYKSAHPNQSLPLHLMTFVDYWRKWATTAAKAQARRPAPITNFNEPTAAELEAQRAELEAARKAIRPDWEKAVVNE